jgi:uncharacterized protein YqfB (UPF0267 family)
MLFKPEHVEMIRKGIKTQTRRNWKKRMVKPGGIYKVKTQMLSKDYHCTIKVKSCLKERLRDISAFDAMCEGNYTPHEFKEIWMKINGSWDRNMEVYVIDFECVELAEVNDWNYYHPVGSPIILTNDFGKKEYIKTKSPAWLLNGIPVVDVDRHPGGGAYRLDRIMGVDVP